MLIKIHGSTPPRHDTTLCDTCRHADMIRGHRLEEHVVFCQGVSYRPVRVTFRVMTCSKYQDDREPTYDELLEKAWILRPPTKRRTAGFVRVSDLDDHEAAKLFAARCGEEEE